MSKERELLIRATTALRDIYMGYNPKDVDTNGVDDLIMELVIHLRQQGVDDEGGWEIPGLTDHISASKPDPVEKTYHLEYRTERMLEDGEVVAEDLTRNVVAKSYAKAVEILFEDHFKANRPEFRQSAFIVAVKGPENDDEDPVPRLIERGLSSDPDYYLNPVNNGAVWIDVGSIAIHLKRTTEGVFITAYPSGHEMSEPLLDRAIAYQDAFEARAEDFNEVVND